MDWLSDKIDGALSWIAALFVQLFNAVINLIKDVFVWLFDTILSVIASAIELLPVPDFMTQGLSGLFTALPSGLLYLLDATGMIAGLAVVGAGVLFNLVRKALTLGQW